MKIAIYKILQLKSIKAIEFTRLLIIINTSHILQILQIQKYKSKRILLSIK